MANRADPFQGADDARRFVVEYVIVAATLCFGFGMFITRHGTLPGTVVLVLSTCFFEFKFGRRGKRFGIKPRYGFRRVSNEARAIEVLRIRHLRSALREIGLSQNLGTAVLVIMSLALGVTGHWLLR